MRPPVDVACDELHPREQVFEARFAREPLQQDGRDHTAHAAAVETEDRACSPSQRDGSAARVGGHRYGDGMGLNPFRAQAKRGTDLVIVAIALAVVAALVLWAVFG